jgi:LasA protease
LELSIIRWVRVKLIDKLQYIFYVVVSFILVSCANNTPQVIVITSTFLPTSSEPIIATPINPTQVSVIEPKPTVANVSSATLPSEYIVQPGDTLSAIAVNYNLSLQSILTINRIQNADLLEIGQVLIFPESPSSFTPNFQIVPDARLINSPSVINFQVGTFISSQPGYISVATDTVSTRLADGTVLQELLTAEAVINRVSLEYSIDPRILLTLLEYRAGWLSQSNVSDDLQVYPIISAENSNGIDRSGLYKQLSWLSNELNHGYYGWKYRGRNIVDFQDGTRFIYEPTLNAGTVALQYTLALNNSVSQWSLDVSENGFSATYQSYFGEAFVDNIELIQYPLSQPELTLPFPSGDIWRFTGGFHGGWGGGSAWASVDFAPPDDRQDGDSFCYISQFPVTAVSSGVIARVGGGALVLDIDSDGYESSGWTILYLHLSIDPTLTLGQAVQVGDKLGYASCHGGFSTATHLHIARRYNGEWIPADCLNCPEQYQSPSFSMSNWEVVGLQNQEYQGYMINTSTNQQVVAEQGRKVTINEISW